MPHHASPDLAAGSWSSMVGEAAVAARNARLAQPTGTVEDRREVTWGAPDASWGLVRVQYHHDAFWVTQQFDGPPGPPIRHASIVDIFRQGGTVPPDDATLRKLHMLRASASAPVDFSTPEPRTEV